MRECPQCETERKERLFAEDSDICRICVEHNHRAALAACTNVRDKNIRAVEMKETTAEHEPNRVAAREKAPPRHYPVRLAKAPFGGMKNE